MKKRESRAKVVTVSWAASMLADSFDTEAAIAVGTASAINMTSIVLKHVLIIHIPQRGL